MEQQTLKNLYCGRYRVAPENYAKSVFRRTLHRRTMIFAPLMRFIRPDFFADDLDLIEAVGRCRSREEARTEMHTRFWDANAAASWKRRFRLRVSTRRLSHLVRDVFHTSEAQFPATPTARTLPAPTR